MRLMRGLAAMAGYRVIVWTKEELALVEDEIEGKVLVPVKTAAILKSLQDELQRTRKELYGRH